MQEDNIEPSESFLYELGTFLEKNGRKAPFVVPTKQGAPSKTTQVVTPVTSDKGRFLQAIVKNDLTTAVALKKQ